MDPSRSNTAWQCRRRVVEFAAYVSNSNGRLRRDGDPAEDEFLSVLVAAAPTSVQPMSLATHWRSTNAADWQWCS